MESPDINVLIQSMLFVCHFTDDKLWLKGTDDHGTLLGQFFICWITLHFKEFQSVVIEKEIKKI